MAAVYHCISRTVAGAFLLDDAAKSILVKQMFRQAHFCGLEVLTYCIMSNHFHILVRVPPDAGTVSDAQLLERVEGFYGARGQIPMLVRQDLERARAIGPELRTRLLCRMGDVSVFMKELKQRFSCWYNRTMDRFGTLWAERFRSVLVEDASTTLRIVAAYIDLNPVRAGLATRAGEYRHSGLSAALDGDARIQAGIGRCVGQADWGSAMPEYRAIADSASPHPAPNDPSGALPSATGGAPSPAIPAGLAGLLAFRLRHFSDGVFLGSRAFVDEMFQCHRRHFSTRRTTGARRIRGSAVPGLMTFRDLRKNVRGAAPKRLPAPVG